MHARCWPYADDGKNLLKLGTEVVLVLVFLATAVMRSALTRHDMVDAKLLREEDLTEEERDMPELLSVFMVLVSVLIPFTILLYNKFKKPDEQHEGEPDDDTNAGAEDETSGDFVNPLGRKEIYNKFKKSDEKQDCDPLSAADIDIDTGRTSSSTKKAKQKPEKENKPTKRESASTRNTRMDNPMFDAAGSSESDEEESPTGRFTSAKAAHKKQTQT